MEKTKNILGKAKQLVDNVSTIAVKVAEVVAGVSLFRCDQVQTVAGQLPVPQILAAILIADVVIFALRLVAAQNKKAE